MTRILIATAMLCLAYATPSYAQSLTGNAGSAGIFAGEQATEARIGIDDEGNAAARVHYEYAFTEWYQLRVIGAFAQPDGGDWDFDSLTLENWFQWREETKDNSSFNGGFRFAYSFNEGDGPDEAEVRFAITDKFGEGWEWRGNLIGEVEVGDGSESGVGLESRLQLTRAVALSALGTQDWRFGAELFSEYGNSRAIPGLNRQAHQLGPVVKASWDNGVFLQSAVRVGVTDGADDAMFKLFIGREF